MGDWGIKISKPGYDVKTTGEVNLLMSSKFNHFKILSSGTLTVAVSGGTGHTHLAHSLGYAPFVMAYEKGWPDNDKWWFMPATLYSCDGAGCYAQCQARFLSYPTEILFIVDAWDYGSPPTYEIGYFIFVETAAT